jgi:hypothetical protein
MQKASPGMLLQPFVSKNRFCFLWMALDFWDARKALIFFL